MLASIFILEGYDKLRQPGQVASVAEPVVNPLAENVPGVPADTEQAVRVNGAVQLAAGSLLALGRFPRLSALAIAATLVPTTAAGHRFWEAQSKEDRAEQRIHFLKNLSMLGGLLIAAADTGGRPSLAWRSRHAAASARHDLAQAGRAAKRSGKVAKASGKAGATAGRVSGKVAKAPGKAGAKAARVSGKVAKAPGKVAKAPGKVAKASGKAGATAGRLSSRLPGR